MTIAFVHHDKAFLPALQFYPAFFSKYSIKCEIVTKDKLKLVNHDVEWFFMGIDNQLSASGILKIHEYISPSVPPARKLKDLYKRSFNVRPNLRIFKTEYVRNCFRFNDSVPFLYQDIGIPQEWLVSAAAEQNKEFDFVYIGELSPQRNPTKLLDAFARPGLKQHSLLLLSKNYAELQARYADHKNIIFKGPVSTGEVRQYLRNARFAINYIPDKEPFNELTSTKLLEYAANKIPIITTDYKWVRSFQKIYGGEFYYLDDQLSNFNWEKINAFDFEFPDLSEWTWESQIRKSKLLDFLTLKFPELTW